MSVALSRAEARPRTDAPQSMGRAPIGWPQTLLFALLASTQLLWVALLAYTVWFAVTP